MRSMLYAVAGICFSLVVIVGATIFVQPSIFLDFNIFPHSGELFSSEEIFLTIKPLEYQLLVTTTRRPKSDLTWSPHKNYLAFYERILENDAVSYDKEWALQILNPRTFQIKTVFIGDSRTSNYEWVDDQIVRVYMNAGTGVRIYRDIDIHIPEPFAAAEHRLPEFWKSQYNAKYRESGEEWRDIEPSGIEKLKDY